jgi:hypothetical protein
MVKMFTAHRDKNGNLPPNPLSLSPDSDLIDAGIDVGLPYFGEAPDIGAYEFGNLTIEITAPHLNSEYDQGDNVLIFATAKDPDNEITGVNFFIKKKAIWLGQGEAVNDSTFRLSWNIDTVGVQDLRAVAYNNNGDSATSASLTLIIHPFLEEGLKWKIFPNPNWGSFNLLLKDPLPSDSDINIYGTDGRLYAKREMKKNDLYKHFDDLSFLAPGYYIMQFTNQKSQKQFLGDPVKFLKQE